MNQSTNRLLVLSVFSILLFSSLSLAQIVIDPIGYAFSVNQGDELQTTLTLTNELEVPVAFKIDQEIVAEPEARDQQGRGLRSVSKNSGPVRDRRGGPDDAEYEWRDSNENDGPDFEWIDVRNSQNVQRLQAGDDINIGPFNLGFQFPWYGQNYNQIRLCSNGWLTFSGSQTNAIGVANCPNNADPNAIIAALNYDLLPGDGSWFYWTDGEEMAVVQYQECPRFNNANMRATFETILYADGFVKIQIADLVQFNLADPMIGFENADGSRGFSIVDRGRGEGTIEAGLAIGIGPRNTWRNWFVLESNEGVIDPGESIEIPATILPEDSPVGVHELLITGIVTSEDDVELGTFELSAFMSVQSPVGEIAGQVTDSRTNAVIEGVKASINNHFFARFSDAEGHYSLADLPVAAYSVTFSAPDYLPTTEEVDLGEDGVELNVALLQAECNLSTDGIDEQLAPDTDMHVNFTVSNDGNGPLTYSVERRLLGDANAAPWQLRREYQIGNAVEDTRVEGVAFDGTNFYFSGANDADPNTIYITDREGQPTGSFVQPGESRYGMKDLEWDGDLLWGAGEARVFGFDTEGNIHHQFQGPFNPATNCIAYDSDRDILWIAATTSNIAPYTKEGQAAGAQINSKRLRIYGLAYWPDDPDGYPLYILNAPNDTMMAVHKMDPESGDTMRVHDVDRLVGATPGGAFICNTFDVYSWVMMFMNNVPPANGGDRNFIYQLDARKEWFQLDPVGGVVQADGVQEFDLHLNAAGLPPVVFQGELLFTHDGDGSVAILPIRLDVVEGPVHSERRLPLVTGWNLVSANLQPDEEDIVILTEGLVNAGQLLMVKDDNGHFYTPANGFSNLEGWDVAEGYWLKVRQPGELRVAGMTVLADDAIALHEGWQSVSYYPRRAVDATIALSGIENTLHIAKDGQGNFYLPAYGFSNIGDMREGRGYQLKATASAELIYRTRLPEQFTGRGSRAISVYDRPGRYAVHPVTGANMSLLVTAKVIDGTDVGVYANGVLVGCGVIESGKAGVAVWGDDPSTEAVDGALAGDALTVFLRDDAGERAATVRQLQGSMTYATDGLAVVEVESVEMPVEFGLTGAWPNPFNGRLTAGFDLPESGFVTVGLYDLSGREVMRVMSGRLPSGRHEFGLNGESLSSGIYVLRVESAGRVSQLKVALVK